MLLAGGGTSCVGDSNAGVLRELKAALGVTQKDASTEADRRQSMSGRRSSVSGRRGRRMIVAVLDEMDQLISQDQSILYELFTLATVGIHLIRPSFVRWPDLVCASAILIVTPSILMPLSVSLALFMCMVSCVSNITSVFREA